jgi:hypothetical protein
MQSEIHWEKIGIYLTLLIGFLTVIFYIADIKERVAKLEVKIEHLENKQNVL